MGLWTYEKMKRNRKRILIPLQCVNQEYQSLLMKKGSCPRPLSCEEPDLELPDFRTVKYKCFLFRSLHIAFEYTNILTCVCLMKYIERSKMVTLCVVIRCPEPLPT